MKKTSNFTPGGLCTQGLILWLTLSLLSFAAALSPRTAELPVRDVVETTPDAQGFWQRVELVDLPGGRAAESSSSLRVISEMRELEEGRSELLTTLVEKADTVMVELQPRVSPRVLDIILEPLEVAFEALPDPALGENVFLVVLESPTLESVPAVVAHLQKFPNAIASAESDVAVVSGDGFSAAVLQSQSTSSIPRSGGEEDPLVAESDYFADQKIDETWAMSAGSGVVVAVIDTGIDLDHVDLVENLWKNEKEVAGNYIDDDGNGHIDDIVGWDFGGWGNLNKGDAYPEYGHDSKSMARDHGTMMAGVIGSSRNSVLTRGIAYDSELMILRNTTELWDQYPIAFAGDTARSINYAVKNGASIINCSFHTRDRKVLRKAIGFARSSGVLIVTGAGNKGKEIEPGAFQYDYPALYTKDFSNVIAVGVVNEEGQRVSYSNFSSTYVNLAVPEWNGYQLLVENSCFNSSNGGTSTGAAVVSSVAAQIKSLHPEWNPAQIRSHLENHVIKKSALTNAFVTGGYLDLYGAVKSAHTGHLHFEGAKWQVYDEEDSPSVEFTFERQGGTLGEVSVSSEIYHVHTSPEDFENSNLPTLHWADGEAGAKSFTLQIANDDHSESDEIFALQVQAEGFSSQASGYPLYGINKITDSDYAQNQVGFVVPLYTVDEDAGSVHVPVKRTQSKGKVEVVYEIIHLTTQTRDIANLVSTGVLTWEDGQAGVRSIPIYLKNDMALEQTEALQLIIYPLYPLPPKHVIDYQRNQFHLVIKDDDGNHKGAVNFKISP